MDRNTATGLALIALLIIVWAYFFAPTPPAKQQAKAETAAPADTAKADAGPQPTVKPADEKNADAQLADRLGRFAVVGKGTDKTIRITTDKLQLEVNTHGGQLQPVILREFKTYTGQPQAAFPGGADSKFAVLFRHNNRIIDTRDLYYVPSLQTDVTLTGEAKQTLNLRAEVEPGKYLEHAYTFTGNTYDVNYTFRTVGMDELITNNNYDLQATMLVPRSEKNFETQRAETTLYYNYSDEVEKLDPTKKELVDKGVQGSIKWVSFRTQFFSTAIIGATPFEAVSLKTMPMDVGITGGLKKMEAFMQIPYKHSADESSQFTLYFGPNSYSELKKYDLKLEDQLELGWAIFGWINKFLIMPVFKFLEGFTTNYGLIILLLAVFVKTLIFPLTYRSYLSTAKMQIVNSLDEVKEMDEKYKDDPLKLQNMKMQFYNSAGVSPFSGCIPLLLQLPILGAMFNFFPKSIELRQQPFWWADDLSTFDPIINFGFSIPFLGNHIAGFALLMTISQVAVTWIMQRGQTPTGPAAQMQFIGYLMPVVFFVFFLNAYSSGLSWYYLVVNVITIVQTYGIKAFVNEEKIKNQIHETRANKKKGTPTKSGGGLAGWVERQQKKQQEILRERAKMRRGGR
jgi:YidC/Oxa1 family membrane protein insertase